jgi:hypothetical protein
VISGRPGGRALSYPLPSWERVASIARCEPGEGFRSIDRP